MLAEGQINIPIDSLESIYPLKDDLAGVANKLALQNQFGNTDNQLISGQKEVKYNFDAANFACLYNNGLNILKTNNLEYFNDLLDYADSSGIDLYISRIRILSALNKYFNHQVTESFRLLYELGEMSVLNDEYFNMLGILALDVKSPRLAIDYFERTSTQINDKYRLNLAIAYLEAGMQRQAEEAFQSLRNSEDASVGTVSNEYLNLFKVYSDARLDSINDEKKYLVYHYMINKQDTSGVADLMTSIENPAIRDLIRLEQVREMLRINESRTAFEYFSAIESSRLLPEMMVDYGRIKYLMAVNGLVDAGGIPEVGQLESDHPLYLYDQLLYSSLNAGKRDSLNLDSVFIKLATWDPFFDEGVMAATEYFKNERNQSNYSYNLLVNALSVNSYSIPLNKYFIQYCLEEGLVDFARNRLDFMESFMEKAEYGEYYKEMDAIITRKESELQAWGS